MREKQKRFLEGAKQWLGPALFAGSLALYLATLCRSPFPGESARMIVQHAGLDPFPPMSHPLWTVLVRAVALVPLATLTVRVNFLSAVFGAIAVGLIYRIVSKIPHNRTTEEIEAHFPAGPVEALSGMAAALFLAVCTPFWVASTQARPATFDVCLLLGAVDLLIRFAETRRLGFVYAFALVYGLGTTEFATFITLAPLFVLCALFLLWRSGHLRAGTVSVAVLLYLAGLSVYFLAAGQYCLTPAFAWRKFNSYFRVLWYIWREQYRAIAFSVSQVGWLLIFMVSILPWLAVVVFPKQTTTRSTVMGSHFLHAVLAVLAVFVLFNVHFVAPWSFLKLRPLLVTPYVFMASWAGYLAGYWYIFFWKYSRFGSQVTQRVRQLGRPLYGGVLAAIFLVGATTGFRVADARPARVLKQFADEVVQRLGGRTWLVSSSPLDDVILLSAQERGVPLKLLNTGQNRAEAYLKYAATLFDSPRLKGLAQIGLLPLIDEWLAARPGMEKEAAVLMSPDIWYSAGYTPVPDGVLFLGRTNAASLDGQALFNEQYAFWTGYGQTLKREARRDDTLVVPWTRWALSQVSKAANNTGVLLEDMGHTNLAFDAYRAARDLDTNNVSALLNLLSLANRAQRPERDALNAEFDSFVRRLRGGKLAVQSLAYYCGYVRYPEAFSERGWSWALSGKPNLAVREMKRAVELGADKERADLAMASFYAMHDLGEQSEQMLRDVLNSDTNNAAALLALTRLSARKGDAEAARTYLERLEQSHAAITDVRLERASLELLAGNPAAARDILDRVIEKEPGNLRAWTLRAQAAHLEKDDAALDKCLSKLTSSSATPPGVLTVLAQIAISRRDLKSARKYLDGVLRSQPANRLALQWLLQVDIWEADRQMAEEHAERLLTLDPKNGLGNLILGSLQSSRQEYELAEASYRTSLESKRSPEALNDLAYLLQMKGKYDEARLLVREALSLDARNAAAWDTLGVVSMRMDTLDEAQKALQQALSLQPENPHFILHMAQLYDLKGMKDEALRLADPLLARAAEMQPDAYEELRDLIKKLRAGT